MNDRDYEAVEYALNKMLKRAINNDSLSKPVNAEMYEAFWCDYDEYLKNEGQ